MFLFCRQSSPSATKKDLDAAELRLRQFILAAVNGEVTTLQTLTAQIKQSDDSLKEAVDKQKDN